MFKIKQKNLLTWARWKVVLQLHQIVYIVCRNKFPISPTIALNIKLFTVCYIMQNVVPYNPSSTTTTTTTPNYMNQCCLMNQHCPGLYVLVFFLYKMYIKLVFTHTISHSLIHFTLTIAIQTHTHTCSQTFVWLILVIVKTFQLLS